jgi:tRNA uridine 5-carbamoylmethylation protein Kti12
MSGGTFNYSQFRIEETADEVRQLAERYSKPDSNEYWPRPAFAPETIALMRACADTLTLAGNMLHEVDYLFAGDTGEDTFRERMAKVMKNGESNTDV